jgi:hypothetical protein
MNDDRGDRTANKVLLTCWRLNNDQAKLNSDIRS